LNSGGAHYRFIKIPRIYQSIDFTDAVNEKPDGASLVARTSDGLAVSLDLSFQYRLTPEDTLSLFDKFALNYKQTIISVSRDVLRDTASTFSALEFFSNRSAIGAAMKQDLKNELSQIFITLEFFQLRDVVLSTVYGTYCIL
jgi:regulator of protease activity HflC (stomatin/prohibitin superfamily)